MVEEINRVLELERFLFSFFTLYSNPDKAKTLDIDIKRFLWALMDRYQTVLNEILMNDNPRNGQMNRQLHTQVNELTSNLDLLCSIDK